MESEQCRLLVQGSRGLGDATEGSIKTILVPASGSETDRTVFCAALAVARPLQAHLTFLHLRLSGAGTASPSCLEGPTMPQERGEFPGRRHDSNLAVSAAHYVQQFCHENAIDCGGQLVTGGRVSATCLEESGPPVKALLFHARHSDLVVLGRRQHADGMPATLVEDLLMGSGRPMLLVPPTVRRELLGNVIIGWKEGSQAARALTAALPLLRLAKQVFLVNVAEDDATSTQALEQVRQQLAWHEISAQVQRIADGSASASTLLSRTAEELKAGLLVVGGFSHSRIRETMFGGVTRSLIDDASLPVLMVH